MISRTDRSFVELNTLMIGIKLSGVQERPQPSFGRVPILRIRDRDSGTLMHRAVP